MIFEKMLNDAGCEILLESYPTNFKKYKDNIKSIILNDKLAWWKMEE